jgi:hypothetical protein
VSAEHDADDAPDGVKVDAPEMQSTPALDDLVRRYAEAKEWVDYWTDTLDAVKAELVGHLHPGPYGVRLVRKGTTVATYSRYHRSTFDTTRFRAEFPDLHRQFSKSAPASRLVVHPA